MVESGLGRGRVEVLIVFFLRVVSSRCKGGNSFRGYGRVIKNCVC